MGARDGDQARRRKATRAGRQRGCYIYVRAEELDRAGYPPSEPPPYYRVWGTQRGGVMVRLYREP